LGGPVRRNLLANLMVREIPLHVVRRWGYVSSSSPQMRQIGFGTSLKDDCCWRRVQFWSQKVVVAFLRQPHDVGSCFKLDERVWWLEGSVEMDRGAGDGLGMRFEIIVW
jgi:hypothetical protein